MKKVLSCAAGAAILAASFAASAQTGQIERSGSTASTVPASSSNISAHEARARNAWAARNLTPYRMQLQILAGPTSGQALSINGAAPEFGLNFLRRDYGDTSEVIVAMPLGLAFGVMDNLEVGIGLPIYFKPGDFGDLPLWATYQFMNGPFQMGARLALYMPTATDFQLQAGLPMLLRTGTFRLDTGVFAHFAFSDPVQTRVFAPLRIGFQISPELYAGVQTELGVSFIKVLDESFVNFTMPLYGFVGYTLHGGLGPIDLGFRFGFDNFINAGDYVGDTIEAGNFSFAVGANVGLQF